MSTTILQKLIRLYKQNTDKFTSLIMWQLHLAHYHFCRRLISLALISYLKWEKSDPEISAYLLILINWVHLSGQIRSVHLWENISKYIHMEVEKL